MGGVRVEPNSIVEGPAGNLLIESTHLDDPLEISAIGNSSGLTGSLTRPGGIVAQLGSDRSDGPADRDPARHAASAGHDPDTRTGAWDASALIPSRPDVTSPATVLQPVHAREPWLTTLHW